MEPPEGRNLTPSEVEEYLARQGYTHYLDQIALYADADGAVFFDAVFGPVLEWRDPSGRWHYISVSPEWALENLKPEFDSPWFPEGPSAEAEAQLKAMAEAAQRGAKAGAEFARNILPNPMDPLNKALDLAFPALVVAGIIGVAIIAKELRSNA